MEARPGPPRKAAADSTVTHSRLPDTLQIGVGETYDFELRPEAGRYQLVAEIRNKPLWTRELVVR